MKFKFMRIKTGFFYLGFFIMMTSIIIDLTTGPNVAINGEMYIQSSDGNYNATRHFEVFMEENLFESVTIFTETGLNNIIEVKSSGEIYKNTPNLFTISIFDESHNQAVINNYNKIPLYNEYISAKRKLIGSQTVQIVEKLQDDYIVIVTNGWSRHMIAINQVIK